MTKFVAIVSGKGGVGKTTTTINLASAMLLNNHDSIIVDANLSTPNVGVHLGINNVPITFHDVLEGKNHILESIYKHDSGLRVIVSDLFYDRNFNFDKNKIEHAFLDLVGHTNHVLVDTSAGIGEETKNPLSFCDEALIVCNPELSSVVDARKMIKICEDLGVSVGGIIVSRYKGDNFDVSIKNIEHILEHRVISIIPEDDHVRKSQYDKIPVCNFNPNSHSSRSYNLLANKIIQNNFNLKY